MAARAFVVTGKDAFEIQDVEKPSLSANQILVKNEAVALNPTDWKHLAFISPAGAWLGCDFSGTVESAGADVSNVKVGDRVAGFVHGGREEDKGSFATYVRTEGTLVWKVPDGTDAEEAAALGGIGPHTAVQALYFRLKLNKPDNPTKSGDYVLVYGASSSVGLYAVQLATASGYKVIAVASPKNHDLVKSLGAVDAFDYNDPGFPAKIAAKYEIKYALDTISEKGSTEQVAKSVAKHAHVVTLLPPPKEGVRDDVKVEMTLVYTVLGKAFDMGVHFPLNLDDKSGIESWSAYVPALVESGKLKANPLLRKEGGLDGIINGLKELKGGKVSASKITFKI